MHREDRKAVVVSVADFFATSQPDSSPLSPAAGLGLPHLSRAPGPDLDLGSGSEDLLLDESEAEPGYLAEPEPADWSDPEPVAEADLVLAADDAAPVPALVDVEVGTIPVELEPVPVPAAPIVKIAPAYALRPLSDALCPGCGEPRHSAGPHQHGPVSSLDD